MICCLGFLPVVLAVEFWDTVFYAKEIEGGLGAVPLLMTPVPGTLTVHRAGDETVLFQENIDYAVEGGNKIRNLTGSAIPVRILYSAKVAGYHTRLVNNGKYVYSPGGNVKHEGYDITVRYTPQSLDPLEALFAPVGTVAPVLPLPTGADEEGRIQQRGGRLGITLIGDSISLGAQSSGYQLDPTKNTFPFQGGYGDLFADYLRKTVYTGMNTVEFANLSKGGTTAAWGAEARQKERVGIANPDLLVIAFGMNDGSTEVPVGTFKPNIRAIITNARTVNPHCAIILVNSMFPNPDTRSVTGYDGIYEEPLRNAYGDALRSLAAEFHGGYLDMGEVTRRLYALKPFTSFSGNNWNHPNDLLQRLYYHGLQKVLSRSVDITRLDPDLAPQVVYVLVEE